jgi:putative phosphoesterase
MKILLLSDIHGNFPALQAVTKQLGAERYDCIINSGDSTVYAPFPNQVLDWLQDHNVISIAGNTDRKVKKLLRGKKFKKPSKEEKRVMYTATASTLTTDNSAWLQQLKKKQYRDMEGKKIGIFHGSPAHADEFLFPDTPTGRFAELGKACAADIVIIGHSHTPFYKSVQDTLFVNPGSVGRMFDGDPRASCAELILEPDSLAVVHHRIPYPIDEVVAEIRRQGLPDIYCTMYRRGRKLN